MVTRKTGACTSLHLYSQILSRNHIIRLVGAGISVVITNSDTTSKTDKMMEGSLYLNVPTSANSC